MKEGKIYDYGTPKDVINYESLKNVYNIKCHIHEHYNKLIITPIDVDRKI